MKKREKERKPSFNYPWISRSKIIIYNIEEKLGKEWFLEVFFIFIFIYINFGIYIYIYMWRTFDSESFFNEDKQVGTTC